MVNANSRKPSARALAAAVYESSPPLSRTTASDTACVRTPDVFVQLQLDAHRQLVSQHPFRQHLWIEDSMHRRQMNRRGAANELVACDDIAGKLVVAAILDDELDLVLRTQALEIFPVVLRDLAAARTLHIEDRHDVRRHTFRAAMAAGLEQHRLATVEQTLHKEVHLFLQQRLAAGDLDQRAAVSIDLIDDIVQGTLAALVKGIRRIAPATAQIAGGETHEHTRPSGVCGLSLHRMEDFVDGEHSRSVRLQPDWQLVIVLTWACASERRAGTTPPGRANGTGSSIRQPAPSAPGPPISTNCASTRNISTRSK